jgi:hypothetical protein
MKFSIDNKDNGWLVRGSAYTRVYLYSNNGYKFMFSKANIIINKLGLFQACSLNSL